MFGFGSHEEEIKNQRNGFEKRVWELEYEIKQFEDRWTKLCVENENLHKTLEVFIHSLKDEDRLIDLANRIRQYPGESILSLFKEAFPEIYER